MDILLFLLGIHMCILLLAASYRIVDLWYRIGDFLAGILTRIFLLAALDVGLALLLPDNLQTAFIAGQISFLVFHIVIFWLGRFAILLLESKNR